MSWKWLPERFNSLALRLGVSYSLIFGLVSVVGIFLLNIMISSYVMRGVDLRLIEEKRTIAHYAAFHDRHFVKGKFYDEAEARGTSRIFYNLFSTQGEQIASSDSSAWKDSVWDSNWLVLAESEEMVLTDLVLDDDRIRARVLSAFVGEKLILQITTSLKDEMAFLVKVRMASAILVLAMVMVGVGVGSVMAKKALAGLGTVNLAVKRLADGDLTERVTLTGTPNELARLGRTYNRMADRIEILVREMQEVNDNIAHDLRSPVTRIRGLAEMAAAKGDFAESDMEIMGSIVEECDRQIHMINTMLEISETEAGLGEMTLGYMGVKELISKTKDLFFPLAEENDIRLETDSLENFTIQGDLRKIQRAFANLVENAIKYTLPGGRIFLSTTLKNDTIRILVTDTGIGISPEALPKVFDRFYRGDISRSMPGNGLGLSLAMAIAHAHDGTIEIESALNQGTTCSLCLPCPK